MIARRASWVLASIARRGDGDLPAARRAAYDALDPMIRRWVRRRVERSVAHAVFETRHADDERHVHRLAYLRSVGIVGTHPDDVEGVGDAFERTPVTRAPGARSATWTVLLALALGALTIGAGVWRVTRPLAPVHEELAPRADAWTRGGRPLPGTDAARAVFSDALPRYVIALDRHRRARGGEDALAAVAELDAASLHLSAAGEAALGSDATSFLRALADQSRDIVDSGGTAAVDSHLRSLDALNETIASLGLGYYVDAEVLRERRTGQHRVYLSTFSVERVRYYRSGDERIRALCLRRLDQLNFVRAVLGFTREQVSDGLVLLDRVTPYLIDHVLPALAEGASMPLVDDASEGDWIDVVETAAGLDARAEATQNLGDRVAVLGTLLGRRRALLDGWRERFAPEGIHVQRPPSYDLDVEAYALLARRVPRQEWRELEAIAEALSDDAPRTSYRELEQLLIASVERHEVQHRLDYSSDTLSTMPAALEAHVGPLEPDGQENVRARRALAELSAYLSEIARGPQLVKTNLALFAGHLFNRRSWGTAESYAALVTFEGLGREVGFERPLRVGRTIDRAALAELYLALRDVPSARLASLAAELWASLFGRPLPPLVLEE